MKFKINKNTDTVDMRQKCLGLSVVALDCPCGDIYDDRGLHVQIRHNTTLITYDLASEVSSLIAAAPDLLEALENLLANLIDSGEYISEITGIPYDDVKQAIEAIKKAKGES